MMSLIWRNRFAVQSPRSDFTFFTKLPIYVWKATIANTKPIPGSACQPTRHQSNKETEMTSKGTTKRPWRSDPVYMIESNSCEARLIMWPEEILAKLPDDKVSTWRAKKENIDLPVEMAH